MRYYDNTKENLKDIFQTVAITIIICAIIIGIVFSCFIFTLIPTSSMEPTLMQRSFALGFKPYYLLGGTIQRGDIVIIEIDDVKYCKRVIGLPGEIISFEDGKVYIDGQLLDENAYLSPAVYTESRFDEFTIPTDSYFLMGDNREHSLDSREWPFHYISRADILAQMILNFELPTRK